MNFRRLTNGTLPPKGFGIVLLTLAIIFAFGQTAFGLTVTTPVDSLPIGASVNDFDGDHNFMMAFEISLLAADIPWAAGDDIEITCPTGVYIADTDAGADYDNEVGFSWGATNDIGAITIASATSQTVTLNVALTGAVSDGDAITVYFPVITSPSLADGDTTSFIVTLKDIDTPANDLMEYAHVTFRDNINLVTFSANYLGGDDETDTDGNIWPDGGAAAITVALPDLITDQSDANEGLLADATDWTQITSDGDAATALDNDDAGTDEVTFSLWASKYDTVTKITGAVAEVVVALDNATGLQIADYEDGTMTYALDASQLEEGNWYFYVTSSVTADWVIGMSDAVSIRHYPFFTDSDNDAIGIDFDGDEIFEPGTDDDVSTVVMDVSGGLGKDGTIGGTSASDVDFYISVNDYDDEATFQIFRVPSSVTPTADSIKMSGSSPNLTVTGLGGGTAITAQSVLAELPYSIVNYSAIRSAADYDPVGDYNIWVVANDGKHQAIQRMKNNGGGSNLELTISTFPKFNFVSNGDVTVNTSTQEYLLINWGRTIDMDNDVDNTMRINLYCSDLAWGAANSGASTTPANVDTTKLPADAIADPTHTVHIATIVDTSDTQQANRYMWNVRESGLAVGGPYYIYAVVTSGPDAVIVRMNDLENMAEAAANIDELTLAHGTYFLPESPVEGEIANLGIGDSYQLKWTGFDLDAVTEMKVAAFIVPEGDAAPPVAGTDDYASVNGTDGWYWLTNDLAGGNPDLIQVWANAADLTSGRLVVDVSDVTTEMDGDAADPSGNYDIWFLWDTGAGEGAGSEDWDGADDGIVKADGKLYFSGAADKNNTYNFRMEPTQIVMEKGDTLTVSVYASDANPGGGNDVMWLECYLNVPSEFYGIVDQDGGTGAVEGFTPNTVNFAGVTTKNIAVDSTDHFELDLIRHASDLATETDLNDEVVATFQIYAKTDAVSEALESAAITFNTTGERICRMFDADFTQLTANVPAAATTLSMTPRGKITGLIDVEGRADSSQTVVVWVCPTGSFDNITDASFIAANGDSDVSDGITLTLDANGRYNLTAVPTGIYDILAAKTGWLDQQETTVTVQAYSTTTVDFYNADRLYAGDCAGYDHDGDTNTDALPDNQINSTDHSVFESAFEATPSDPSWNMYCDIDADSEITINDIHYSAVNSVPGNGDGILYKKADASVETLAELIELKKDKNVITYAVVAKNFPALQSYSAKVFIDGESWELVEYSDELHETDAKLCFEKVSGYNHDFVCSSYGNIGSREMDPTLVTFTVRALVENPEKPRLQEAMLVDVYHRLNTPVISSEVDENENALPTEFSLSKNFPNPFNPTTTINFALPKSGQVTLTVFNMLGQKVRTLVSSKMAAGNFKAMWDAQDEYGMRVSSGVYFYRLQVDSKVIGTEKMLLLK